MTEHIFRSLAGADVEVRDGRTVAGILVPWDTPVRINEALNEGFRSMTFDPQIRGFAAGRTVDTGGVPRVPFARGHLGPNGTLGGTAVGKVAMLKRDAAGLYGEARVSETPAGDELLTLLRDGVFDELSIGFFPRAVEPASGDGVTWRTAATLTELAVVNMGAFGAAGSKVLAVRAGECPTCGSDAQQRAADEALLRELLEMKRG